MLRLACERFQEYSAATRQRSHTTLEREVPHIVSQPFAAPFEPGGIAFAAALE